MPFELPLEDPLELPLDDPELVPEVDPELDPPLELADPPELDVWPELEELPDDPDEELEPPELEPPELEPPLEEVTAGPPASASASCLALK